MRAALIATLSMIVAVACGRSSLLEGPGTVSGSVDGGRDSAGAPGSGGALGSGGASNAGGTGGTGTQLGPPSAGGAVGSGGVLATGGSVGRGTGGGPFRAGGAVTAGGAIGSGGTALPGSGGQAGRVTDTGGFCGDGTLGPGEQCDLGVDNRTVPAFSVTQAGSTFAVVPVMRFAPCWRFYGYSSDSSHTGFEAVGASRILLYLDTSTLALGLVVFHGVDKDATGLEQPTAHVDMTFTGLPNAPNVCVSDDNDELVLTSPTTASGSWQLTNNSDGGVLCVLPFPDDWEITVKPTRFDGISVWSWVQGDGSLVNLDMTAPLAIRARSSPGKCRPDCTTPRCGDGILDGGEICDDGNPGRLDCGGGCSSSLDGGR